MATSDRHYTACLTACLHTHYIFRPSHTATTHCHYLHSWLYYFGSLNIITSERLLTLLYPAGRREDTEDSGSLPNRKTVTSTLRFRPRSEDNSESIACEAQHPALTREPLRASVKMFVQCKYPLSVLLPLQFLPLFISTVSVCRSPGSS